MPGTTSDVPVCLLLGPPEQARGGPAAPDGRLARRRGVVATVNTTAVTMDDNPRGFVSTPRREVRAVDEEVSWRSSWPSSSCRAASCAQRAELTNRDARPYT